MRVKCIKNAAGIGFAYVAGKEYTVPQGVGKEMLELGFAIPLQNQSELPVDFPGYRVLKDNGFNTISELKQIGTVDELVVIKGIGERLASQIVERLKT